MMFAARAVGDFVSTHPTVQVLALFFFLLLVGVTLIGDSFDRHVPKGYLYCAMAFRRLAQQIAVLNANSRLK